MNLLNNIIGKGKKLLDSYTSGERGIPLPQSVINNQLASSFGDSSPIRSASVELHDGYFDVAATVNSDRGLVELSASVEIQKFVVSKTEQVIHLKLLKPPSIEHKQWLARVIALVMSVILKGVFGTTLLEWGTKDMKGISVVGDLITVDLAVLGATNMIRNALKNRMGVAGELLVGLSVENLGDKVELVKAETAEGVLTVFLRMAN